MKRRAFSALPVTDRPAAGPLSVDCLKSIAELSALRDEWDNLVAQVESASAFQTWEWTQSWYEHFGLDRTLLIFTVRDATGRLVGLAPCSRTSAGFARVRLLHLLGRGNALTERVDAILHPDVAEAVTDAMFDAWHHTAANWDLLVLGAVPADGVFLRGVQRQAARRGYQALARQHVRVTRALPNTWEQFYRSLKKSMKENVNNYVNRLRRDGHRERLVVVEDAADLDGALNIVFDLHQRRAQSNLQRRHDDRFADPARRAFLRTVARRLLERGRIWVCLLEVDDQPVAAQICLLQGGCMTVYYSGYDPTWAAYGVMMVLTRRCIERAIKLGYRELDLLLGMDQEKLRWGCEPRPMMDLALASPRLRSRACWRLYQLNQIYHRYKTRAIVTKQRAPRS